ncbi:autotransporter family protein [Cupriavidus plantarum]|uniref:Outer membrane autotransporter protein n=1 Tax=Cupriavidus plantarum TaxID=942865 RepID=A0A316EWH3_9BURK|nr:autotransporter outer membrane beta-barrel domain-containing protein [Cupriavidus plantarum]PWK35283.1 outer membrane autotransporter protein [Cupriavidus plantarum]
MPRLCRRMLLALSMPVSLAHAASIAVTDGTTQTVDGGTFEGTSSDPALLAANPGSTLVAHSVTAIGHSTSTAVANSGGIIRLTDSTLQGTRGAVLEALRGGQIDAANVSLHALSTSTDGVYAEEGGHVSISGSIITERGFGMLAVNLSTIHSAANVTTRGDDAYAVYTPGAGSRITLLGGQIQTSGIRAYGIFATGSRNLIEGTANVHTSGFAAAGAIAAYGGAVRLSGARIETSGTEASGIAATGSAASLSLADSAVLTSGAKADAALLLDTGTLSITRSALRATGDNAAALRISGAGIATLHDVTLASTQGSSISTDGGVSSVSLYDSVATENNGSWLTVSGASPTVANVLLSGSTVRGAVSTDARNTSNVTLQSSTWMLTGNSVVTTLTNEGGTIQFSPGAGSFHVLQTTNYAGSNGVLAMNTYLGGDGSPSDRLLIDGGHASGTSRLRIANAGGPGSGTTGDGILVVGAANGGTTAPGAFALGAPAISGPYEYTLYRGSVDGSQPDNWYLRSFLSCSGANAPVPPCPAPPGPSPTPPLPHYRPEVSLYAAIPSAALQFGRTLIDSFHERAGEQAMLRGRTDLASRMGPNGAWGRLIGMTGSRDGAANGIYGNGPGYDYRFTGGQIGMDLWRRALDTGHRDTAGAYAAIGRASVDVNHFDGGNAGNDTLDGYTFGGYWTHYGPGDWYVDGVLQYTWYDVQANGHRGLPEMSTNGFAIATAAEAGYPLRLATDWVIEPQAQLIYQWVDLHDATDAGARIGFSDAQSLAGRLGVRLARTWMHGSTGVPRELTAWARVSAWHEFLGDPKTSFSSSAGSIPFRADTAGSWGEIKLGVTGEVARNAFVFMSVGYQRGFDGSREAWDGKIGVRVNW